MNDIKIPEEVNIDAIMYRVVETPDGMIVFTESQGMCFCGNRIAFHRPKYASWQVELFPVFASYMMADHVAKAYELVQEWRGDDFNRPYKK